jgi:hypothetical protein
MKKILSLSLLACLPLCGCPPVIVETNGPPAAVEVDAAPAPDVEYYYVGGVYYYWHPGYNHWEVYHGVPDRRYVTHRMDRLPDRPARREVRRTEHREVHDEHRDDDTSEHR